MGAPPATSTVPLVNRVAVWSLLNCFIEPTSVNDPGVAGHVAHGASISALTTMLATKRPVDLPSVWRR